MENPCWRIRNELTGKLGNENVNFLLDVDHTDFFLLDISKF